MSRSSAAEATTWICTILLWPPGPKVMLALRNTLKIRATFGSHVLRITGVMSRLAPLVPSCSGGISVSLWPYGNLHSSSFHLVTCFHVLHGWSIFSSLETQVAPTETLGPWST